MNYNTIKYKDMFLEDSVLLPSEKLDLFLKTSKAQGLKYEIMYDIICILGLEKEYKQFKEA